MRSVLTPSDACYEDEMTGVVSVHDRESGVDGQTEVALTLAL